MLLLSIPYTLLCFMLAVNVKGIYVTLTQAGSLAEATADIISLPRIAVLVVLQLQWLVFGYFNICGVLEPQELENETFPQLPFPRLHPQVQA